MVHRRPVKRDVLCKMKKRAKKIYQGFAILISLVLIAIGLSPILSKGEMFYSNWRGALVFAPISVIIGLFLLYLVIFNWDKMLKMK
jgi:hypothetical protein